MERIGVIGCGLMGSGIAEICARAGADVMVIERNADALAQGQARVERSLERAVASGKLPEDDANRARGFLSFSEDFARVADCEMVIEAVAEDEELLRNELLSVLAQAWPDLEVIAATEFIKQRHPRSAGRDRYTTEECGRRARADRVGHLDQGPIRGGCRHDPG